MPSLNHVDAGTVDMSDGPYDADHLHNKIVGAVAGVLVPQRAGEPPGQPGRAAA